MLSRKQSYNALFDVVVLCHTLMGLQELDTLTSELV